MIKAEYEDYTKCPTQDVMGACGREPISDWGDEGVRIRRDDTCLGFNVSGRDYPGRKEKVSQIKGSAYNKMSGGSEAQNNTA